MVYVLKYYRDSSSDQLTFWFKTKYLWRWISEIWGTFWILWKIFFHPINNVYGPNRLCVETLGAIYLKRIVWETRSMYIHIELRVCTCALWFWKSHLPFCKILLWIIRFFSLVREYKWWMVHNSISSIRVWLNSSL